MGLFNNKVSCEDITMLETSHPTRIMNLWGTNGIQKPLMNNSTKDLLLFVLYWYYVGLVCISANNNSNLYAYHTRCLLYIYTFDLQGLQGKYFSVCVCHATSWTTWVHMLQHAAVNYVFICEILCWLRTIKLRFRSWRPRGSKQAPFVLLSVFLGVRGPLSLIKCKPDSSNTPPWKQLQPDPWGSIKRHSVETWKKAP